MPAHKPDEGQVCRACGHNPAREKYITKLLLAAVKKAGGELRLPAADVDVLGETAVMAKDYDPSRQELVLRLSSQFSEFYVIAPDVESRAWADPRVYRQERRPEPTQTDGQEPEPKTRHVVVTDEMAAQIEQRLVQRSEARKRQRAEAESVRAVREMSSRK